MSSVLTRIAIAAVLLATLLLSSNLASADGQVLGLSNNRSGRHVCVPFNPDPLHP